MPFFEKPLPPTSTGPISEGVVEPKRPGTSGTELLLTTNRRTASAQYAAAQRAEVAYKAKKRSANARQHRSEAKDHFRQGAWHLKECAKSCCNMFAAVPWMLRSWEQDRKAENEKKVLERFEKKKTKMEAKIAKSQATQGKVDGNEEAAA